MNQQIKKILNHQEQIKKAMQSVHSVKDVVKQGKYRQTYHIMPPAYWMNDPNGFVYFKGRYHLFYQHNPYSVFWGSMHWGHVSSADLVHWIHHPIALAPSENYDICERGGCFSGSAAVDGDRLVVMYTASRIVCGKQIQLQCLAYSDDGIHFEKYEGNPIIECPEELNSSNFRDPKIWKHGESWYCVLGSQKDGDACCAIFCSQDLIHWDYRGVLVQGFGKLGTMWECPDFFPLEDKYVLQCSPMNMGERKAIYLVGTMDYESCRFHWDRMGEIDCGFDFYGPQTMKDPLGRRIMIGWQNEWDWMPWFSGFGANMAENWCGCMSLPRVVTLKENGQLHYEPIPELETMRVGGRHLRAVKVGKESPFPLQIGDNIHFEIKLTLDIKQSTANLINFNLRHSDYENTSISLDLACRKIVFDREHSDYYTKGIVTRELSISCDNDLLILRVFSDTSSIEIFAQDGKVCISSNIFPESTSTGMYLETIDGDAIFQSIDMWEIIIPEVKQK